MGKVQQFVSLFPESGLCQLWSHDAKKVDGLSEVEIDKFLWDTGKNAIS